MVVTHAACSLAVQWVRARARDITARAGLRSNTGLLYDLDEPRPDELAMSVRTTLLRAVALCAAALSLGIATTADAGVGVATCNQSRWCTITASGDVTQFASQLAIGNVSAGGRWPSRSRTSVRIRSVARSSTAA